VIDWRSRNHPASEFGAPSRLVLTRFQRRRLTRALTVDPGLEAWQAAERFGISEREAICLMSHRKERLS